jgi:hypothetical protein
VPDQQQRRLVFIRAFYVNHMLVGFAIAEGKYLEKKAEKLFKELNAEDLHAHYAEPGYFRVIVETVRFRDKRER